MLLDILQVDQSCRVDTTVSHWPFAMQKCNIADCLYVVYTARHYKIIHVYTYTHTMYMYMYICKCTVRAKGAAKTAISSYMVWECCVSTLTL